MRTYPQFTLLLVLFLIPALLTTASQAQGLESLTATVSSQPALAASATDCPAQTQVPQTECETLVTLYSSTDGPNWSDAATNNWNLTQTPCDWTGIECQDGHITVLDRSSQGLNGAIPDLSNLSHLQYLWLDGNQLNGAIPDLSNLSNLEYLWLDRNQLSGAIPDLSGLSNLTDLFLRDNQLSGAIPASVCNVPGIVNLGYNKFTGEESPCVTARDPDWADTQTVPPTAVQAQVLWSSQIRISWEPITYTNDGGYYEVMCSSTQGGPYNSFGKTQDKLATEFALNGLTPDTIYYCVVKTYTPKHEYQQNDLTSIESSEVSATTSKLWLLFFSRQSRSP